MLAKPNYGDDFTLVEKVQVPAPWATYDTTHHSKVAGIAADTGTLDQAIEYERANKNRPGVLSALEEQRASNQPDGDLITA